jgi:hypothetical protein
VLSYSVDVPRRWLDRLLLAGACALVVAVAVDALRPHHAASPARTRAVAAPAGVPERVALRGSPETAFLPTCRLASLRLAVVRASVELRYRGGRCHLPPLGLRATVRDRAGNVVYRGRAVPHWGLAGNLAGAATLTARLAPEVLRAQGRELSVRVAGRGLAAAGRIRCGRGSSLSIH